MRPQLHRFWPVLNYEKCALTCTNRYEQCFIAVDMIIFFGALISPNDGFLFLSGKLLGLKLRNNTT